MTSFLDSTCTDSCGWIAALIAALCYGSYGIPIKETRKIDAHPLVFQTYKTATMFLTCWLVLFLGIRPSFTCWGIVSGSLWVLGGTGGVYAVRLAGMAMAVGTWASVMIMVNFVWGILIFREPVANMYGTVFAFGLLSIGLVGMSHYSSPKKQLKEQHQHQQGGDDGDDDNSSNTDSDEVSTTSTESPPAGEDDMFIEDGKSIMMTATNSSCKINAMSGRHRMQRYGGTDDNGAAVAAVASSPSLYDGGAGGVGGVIHRHISGTNSFSKLHQAETGTLATTTPPVVATPAVMMTTPPAVMTGPGFQSVSSNASFGLFVDEPDGDDQNNESGGGAVGAGAGVAPPIQRTKGHNHPQLQQREHDASELVVLFGGRITTTRRNAGIAGAIFNGLMTGSSLIPLHYAKSNGFGGAHYMISLSIGACIANALVWAVYYLVQVAIVSAATTGTTTATSTSFNSPASPLSVPLSSTASFSASSLSPEAPTPPTTGAAAGAEAPQLQQHRRSAPTNVVNKWQIAYDQMPQWHVKQLWLPGFLAGFLLSMAMFGSILSVTYLGQGVGNSVIQAKILISGLWGIFWYKEIRGRSTVSMWFCSASLTIAGILWLSHERLAATAAANAAASQNADGADDGDHRELMSSSWD